MGIEQSAPTQSPVVSRSSNTNPNNKARQDSTQTSDENGRSSPHPSLCSSDVDVPYVSYTVNRPIGGTNTAFVYIPCDLLESKV